MKSGKKFILTAVLVSVLATVIALTSVITYAEYTKSSRAKRVIASYESSDTLFSSNYMSKNTAAEPSTITNKRVVYASAQNQSAAASITICNYAQGNPGKFYGSDITYVLSAELIAADGTQKRSINSDDTTAGKTAGKTVTISFGGETITLDASDPSARSYTFGSSTLDRRQASSDVYNVEFSPAFNTDDNNIYLYINAIPQGTYEGGISDIDGVLSTAVANAANVVNWTGYFNEAGALGNVNAAVPPQLDGFNYVISGIGATTLRLKWKTSAIVPTQVFTLGKTIETDGAWSYVDFDVDSDTVNRYDLQFYRADGTTDSFETWNVVTGYVTLEQSPSSP